MRESSKLVEFIGLKILLIADDVLVSQDEFAAANVVIRVCPEKLPGVPVSPSAFIVKNLPGGVSVTPAPQKRGD